MWSYLYVSDLPECASVSALIRNSLEIMHSYTESNVMAAIQIFSLVDTATGGVHYYFNPAAKQIGDIVGAKPCDVPCLGFQENEIFLAGSFLDELHIT
ncbi:hypothetical protein ACW5XW_07615 [Aeromonas piscicola]|uniref:hypothetical protein n=1 Tax=Aeromonas piscicola TaxID=600645 RepID=UPI0005B441E2|nr:hypothetical protein [Aeromonas piscicola]